MLIFCLFYCHHPALIGADGGIMVTVRAVRVTPTIIIVNLFHIISPNS
jgi:hypothetical protein